MLTAAKEETFSPPMVWSGDGVLPLAADLCVETRISTTRPRGKKPHQGVAGKNLALEPGRAPANSKLALGLRGAEPETRIRSRCTGKQRDTESNLDYFGARYDASALGRFMSPDPLLNSGRPDDPQTWNRYVYTGNNPLGLTDPTGLYDLVNNCAGDDKKCNKKFESEAKKLRDGLSDLQKRVDNMNDGLQKQRLQAALTAFGTEGDHNGVSATFATLGANDAAQTDFHADDNGSLSATVTFDPSKIADRDEYAIDAAHEGTHIEDFVTEAVNDNIAMGPLQDLEPFQSEYRGYETSIYAASALGASSFSRSHDGIGYVLWNGSWAQVDQNITNYLSTFRDKNGNPVYPEKTPHNPWPN